MLRIKHSDLTLKQQEELEEKIEAAVVKELFLPRQEAIIGFFEKVLSLHEDVQLVKYPEKLEVIDMYYYANCPLGYIMIQPSVEFCHASHFISETTLSLEQYGFGDINEIGLNIFELNNIEISDDFGSLQDTRGNLERNFLMDCWSEAKKKYPESKIKAFGMASDGSGYTFDMDNGMRIAEENGNPDLEAYLSSINVFPSKDLLDPRQESNFQ